MSATRKHATRRPRVLFVGDAAHSDFSDVIELLRHDADVQFGRTERVFPELIVVAQSRPGIVADRHAESLRRSAPLAGIISLLGSWCEGQTRAGRLPHNLLRLYWYEFAAWWHRQVALISAGHCPDWARPQSLNNALPPICHPLSVVRNHEKWQGVAILRTPSWETGDILADVVGGAGFTAIWHPPARTTPLIRGATAGIWEGGQLSDAEAAELSAFCQTMSANSAPVIALLDFPRRDRCESAREAGAAAVLSKPWNNSDLLASLRSLTRSSGRSRAA